MIPYQKGSSPVSQYACERISGVVTIPPPGKPSLSSDFTSALMAKSHTVTASCQISVYCLGAPPLGSGRILPGGRPPVIVLRKGGRSPLVGGSRYVCFFAAAFAWDSKPAQMSDKELDKTTAGASSGTPFTRSLAGSAQTTSNPGACPYGHRALVLRAFCFDHSGFDSLRWLPLLISGL